MAFRLIPREEKFYADFQALAAELQRGAGLLQDMLLPEHPVWAIADEIKAVEETCDSITHEIIQRLNRTFVTPIDREDIHSLAVALDDVMDAIDAAATLVRLYKLDPIRPGARELASTVVSCTKQISPALGALEKNRGLVSHAVEINRLENEADIISRNAVADLFSGRHDMLDVLRWKEIYGRLESAADQCEDVANTIEAIVLKSR